jgi:hypothetical protein
VFGRGRNKKHKGGGPVIGAAANINMRGKKSKVDKCRCCECIDMRDDILLALHKKEMRVVT